MKDSIKNLQTSLAQDLVKLEESNINEEHFEIIEDTYEKVYLLLNNAREN